MRVGRALLLLVLWVGLCSCPSLIYSGDPLTIQDTAANFLDTGHLDVPEVVVINSGEPGAFFCKNPRNGLWFNKYGLANTFFTVPVIAGQKWWSGGYRHDMVRLVLLNLQNLLITLLLAWVMYELACLFTRRYVVAALWVLAAFYATFAWNYLRAQNSEIWQWLEAMVFFWALCRWLRSRKRFWLGLAHVAMFALLLTKTVFVVWAGVFAVAICVSARRSPRPWASLVGNLSPLAVSIGALLYTNWMRFGDCFSSGYTQWRQEANFFSGSLAEGLWGNLTAPDKSIFVYYPLVLLALGGWCLFWRRWRVESCLILACFVSLLLAVSKVTNWGGHWCYGPRYLIAGLPLVSLPAVVAFDELWQRRKRWVVKVAMVLIALILGVSVWMQTEVNRLDYMTYYEVREVLQRHNAARAVMALGRPNFALFNRQMRAWYLEGARPEFITVAEHEVPLEQRDELRLALLKKIKPNSFVKWFEKRREL